MAKKSDDSSWVTWLVVAGLAYLWFKGTPADGEAANSLAPQRDSMDRRVVGGPGDQDVPVRQLHPMPPIWVDERDPIKQAPPVRDPGDYPAVVADYATASPPSIWNPKPFVGKEITLAYGDQPPVPPIGYQWWTPPTGTQPESVTWYLELAGTYHPPVDPRDVLGTSGGGQQEDTQPWPYGGMTM